MQIACLLLPCAARLCQRKASGKAVPFAPAGSNTGLSSRPLASAPALFHGWNAGLSFFAILCCWAFLPILASLPAAAAAGPARQLPAV